MGTLGCLGVGLAIVLVFRVGIPFLMVSLGMGGHFDWTLLRLGHHESHMSLDWAEAVPGDGSSGRRRLGGVILARAGEEVVLSWEASTRRGHSTLLVGGLIGGYDPPLWRRRFEALEEPGNRVFLRDWGGSVAVDWRVE